MSRVRSLLPAGQYAEIHGALNDARRSADWTHLDAAQAAWELGLGDRARKEALEARQILLKEGDKRRLGVAYLWLARCEAYFGDDPRAAGIALEKAREILTKQGSGDERALLTLVSAEVTGSTGELGEAERLAEEAGDRWIRGWAAQERATAALAAGEKEDAARAARAALTEWESDPDRPEVNDLTWRLHAILAGAVDAGRFEDHARTAQESLRSLVAGLPDAVRAPFLARKDRARFSRWVELPSGQRTGPPQERPIRDLKTISRVIRAMNTESRIESQLRLIIDSMIECTGAESGLLVLIERDRVSLAVRRGLGGRDLTAGEAPLSMRIARDVAAGGQTICLEDAGLDPVWKAAQSVADQGLRSVLCVPLRFRERTMGAVFLESRARAGAFRDEDRDIAEVLADQAAVALENALLLAKSIIDPLTGAATHAHFERRLAEEVDRAVRMGRPCSMLLVDLDRFKQINDTHGHDAGSRLLKEAAEVLRRELRMADVTARSGPPSSLVGRYGGDEFEVLLPDTSRDTLPAVAQRVLHALHETRFEVNGKRVAIAASLGGASCPEDARTAEDLFLRADEALYGAKRAGRDCFMAFHLLAQTTSSDQVLLSRYGSEVLALITNVLEGGEDPQATLDRALQSVVQVTGAERGFILIYEGKDRIATRSAFQLREEEFAPDRFRLSFGVITRLVREGQPLRVNNAGADPQFQAHKSVQELGLHSFVAVPVPGKTGPVGLLYLDSTSPRKQFTSEDEQLLLRFGEFLGKALGLTAVTLQKSMQIAQLQHLVASSLKDLQSQYRFDALIGDSAALRQVRMTLDHIARFSYPVLILGETGTGKELVAKAIHGNSTRKDHPLVAVNCAALSRELLESELFGHVKGAFTGADRDRQGLFAAAHQGSLFLDEIGEMPEDLQRKLLRVLQEGEYLPVGATVPVKCDVRILAATHRDLEKEVRDGKFREDLYYRLKVFKVPLPSLRERPEDVALLAQHLLEKTLRESDSGRRTLTPEAMHALARHAWPGNVRELENAIRHAVAFSQDAIRPEHLPSEVLAQPRSQMVAQTVQAFVPTGTGRAVDELWKMLVARTLDEVGWNQSAAAKELGISRNTLARKMKAYGIEKPQ